MAVLMLRDVHGQFHLKLADFGFTTTGTPARIYQSLQRQGTTPYFAPEIVLRHEFSASGDIWAFGCILYEFLYCCFDRRQAFPELPFLASYYSTPNMPAFGIGWDTLQTDPVSLRASIVPYRQEIERSWEVFNGVLRLTFKREGTQRRDAQSLRERMASWMAGNPVDA